ncbi:MAG: RrF2 family transcriptional regulator [Fidelibacterota bacterium]
MLLSRACEYAIQTIIYLAKRGGDNYISVKEISEKSSIPFYFLGKIVQKLNKNGLLISYKGPNGGVALAKPADKITLLEVVEAVDGLEFKNKCVIGLPRCDDNSPCPLHRKWEVVREEIARMLGSRNVSELLDGVEKES